MVLRGTGVSRGNAGVLGQRAAMASARTRTLRAMRSEAASIILPSSAAAPRPSASALRSSSMMRRARVTSVSGGEKNSFAERDLAGVDRPFAFAAERGGAAGAFLVTLGVGEVAEGAVDGAQAIGAAGDDHAADRGMPLVAGVMGVEATDVHRPGAHGGGVVGDAEVERIEPAAELGDGLDVGHAEGGFDQGFQPDAGGEAARLFDLVSPSPRPYRGRQGRPPWGRGSCGGGHPPVPSRRHVTRYM